MSLGGGADEHEAFVDSWDAEFLSYSVEVGFASECVEFSFSRGEV